MHHDTPSVHGVSHTSVVEQQLTIKYGDGAPITRVRCRDTQIGLDVRANLPNWRWKLIPISIFLTTMIAGKHL